MPASKAGKQHQAKDQESQIMPLADSAISSLHPPFETVFLHVPGLIYA